MGPLLFALAAALSFSPALAAEGERPVRPEAASPARIGGWCDALTGEKKEQCLRDERRRRERERQPELRGSCDALVGPAKERCVREGGSIEVDAKAPVD